MITCSHELDKRSADLWSYEAHDALVRGNLELGKFEASVLSALLLGENFCLSTFVEDLEWTSFPLWPGASKGKSHHLFQYHCRLRQSMAHISFLLLQWRRHGESLRGDLSMYRIGSETYSELLGQDGGDILGFSNGYYANLFEG